MSNAPVSPAGSSVWSRRPRRPRRPRPRELVETSVVALLVVLAASRLICHRSLGVTLFCDGSRVDCLCDVLQPTRALRKTMPEVYNFQLLLDDRQQKT
jgi:hypothetical protein